jgi:hypothetical protein
MPRPRRPWLTPEQQARWRARLERDDLDARELRLYHDEQVTRLLWACLSKHILPNFRFTGEPEVNIPELGYPLAADLGGGRPREARTPLPPPFHQREGGRGAPPGRSRVCLDYGPPAQGSLRLP